MGKSVNSEDLGMYIEAVQRYAETGQAESVKGFKAALQAMEAASKRQGSGPLAIAELARVLDLYAELKTATVKEEAEKTKTALYQALLGAA